MDSSGNLHNPESILDIGRRVHAHGWAAGTDGNISVRDPGGRIWITASGSCLGELRESDLVCIDATGASSSTTRPSSEYALHLSVYRQRADVRAVLHAHPPICTALTLAGRSDLLTRQILPEVVLSSGTIAVSPYATPASEEGPQAIRELILNHDLIVLERHGSLTVGDNIVDAYRKLERLEHAAQVLLAAWQLGGVRDLSTDELERLKRVAARLRPRDEA